MTSRILDDMELYDWLNACEVWDVSFFKGRFCTLYFDLMMHVVYDERGLDEGCMMHAAYWN